MELNYHPVLCVSLESSIRDHGGLKASKGMRSGERSTELQE